MKTGNIHVNPANMKLVCYLVEKYSHGVAVANHFILAFWMPGIVPIV